MWPGWGTESKRRLSTSRQEEEDIMKEGSRPPERLANDVPKEGKGKRISRERKLGGNRHLRPG